MPDVITRQTAEEIRLLRATAFPKPGGETITYAFTLNLNDGAAIAAGNRVISAFVERAEPATGRRPVKVSIIRPDGSIANSEIQENVPRPGVGIGIIAAKPAIPTGPGGVDDPIDPGDIPTLQILRYEVQANDPDGRWTVTVQNDSQSDTRFRIRVSHPERQARLKEARVPLSLINRMFAKIVRLVGLRLRLDRQGTVDFSSEFKRLSGLERQLFEIGVVAEVPIAGNDIRLKDINLAQHGVRLASRGGAAVLEVGARFETEGADELDVNNAPDIDITRMTLDGRVILGSRHFTQSRSTDLGGKLLEERTPDVHLDLELDGDVIKSSHFEGRINDSINDKFREIVRRDKTKRVLADIARHLTDSLMFLATGRKSSIFFDIGADADDLIVTYYSRPTIFDKLKGQLPKAPGGVLSPIGGAGPAKPGAPGGVLTPGGGVGPAMPKKPGQLFQNVAFHTTFAGTGGLAPRDAATRAAGDAPRQIEHIVVLMMENRSFDHMLGYLALDGRRPDIDGLRSPGLHSNPVPNSDTAIATHDLGGTIVVTDPDHHHAGVVEQIADGAMSGFVASYLERAAPGDERLVMGYFSKDQLPVFDFLAEQYLVCDRWFCAHPGPTYANRFISLMGETPDLDNIPIGGELAGAMRGDTLFDVLSANGVSWAYVESNIAFLRMYDRHRVDETNIIQRGAFLDLARKGALPAVTWIDPNFGDLEIDDDANDDHPPADVAKGQELVKEIYDALTANRDAWGKTMLVITYDEHGGFFDHVPPHGLAGNTTNPEVAPIHPKGVPFYGPRVPAIVVSPWVAARTATHTVFDHTSIAATILRNFTPAEVSGSDVLGERVRLANDLLGELSTERRGGAAPRCPAPPQARRIAQATLAEAFDPKSFHASIRLFPFGFDFKTMKRAG